MDTDSYFPDDSYHSPSDTQRRLLDRLLLGSRLYFLTGYIWAVMRSRVLVARGRYDRAALARITRDIMQLAEGCGGRFHVTGLDNVRALSGAAVFVSNHMGSLEANILPCLIPSHIPISFVIKESLMRYPLLGPVISAHQPIPVGRTNPRADLQLVLTRGAELLRDGRSIILFPQSTRTTEFRPEDFNSLGVKLAHRAGVPVVPVAVKTDFWRNGVRLRDFGPLDRRQPIHFAFGQSIPVTNSRTAQQAVVDFIQSQLSTWGVAADV